MLFNWLREKVRDAVVLGCEDAMREIDGAAPTPLQTARPQWEEASEEEGEAPVVRLRRLLAVSQVQPGSLPAHKPTARNGRKTHA